MEKLTLHFVIIS